MQLGWEPYAALGGVWAVSNHARVKCILVIYPLPTPSHFL